MSQDNNDFPSDSTPKKEAAPLMLTIPIALHLQDFFSNSSLANGGNDGAALPISMQTAWLIAAADQNHEYYTIEYPQNPKVDSRALLWRTQDYRASMMRRRQLKFESELYRQKSYVYEKNLGNLIYRISKITGIKRDEQVVIDMAQKIAIADEPEAYASFQCEYIKFDEEAFRDEWHKKNFYL